MDTINEIREAAGAQRWVFPKCMLPIAAGLTLALVLASTTAYAQTTSSVGCTTQKAGEGGDTPVVTRSAQKAGEGGDAPVVTRSAQKAGEGGDTPVVTRAQKAGEGGDTPVGQKAAAAVVPCKG